MRWVNAVAVFAIALLILSLKFAKNNLGSKKGVESRNPAQVLVATQVLESGPQQPGKVLTESRQPVNTSENTYATLASLRLAWKQGVDQSYRNLIENEFHEESFGTKVSREISELLKSEDDRQKLWEKLENKAHSNRLRKLGSQGRCFVSKTLITVSDQALILNMEISFRYPYQEKDNRQDFYKRFPIGAHLRLKVGNMIGGSQIYDLRGEKHGDKEFLILDFTKSLSPEAKLISHLAIEFPNSSEDVTEIRIASPQSTRWTSTKAESWKRQPSYFESSDVQDDERIFSMDECLSEEN